jgi:hypothetical protein
MSAVQLAIDVLRWPGMNVAFLFSFFLTIALALVALPCAKRRKKGTRCRGARRCSPRRTSSACCSSRSASSLTSGSTTADKNLGWTKAKIVTGPGGILKPQADGGWLPLTLQYEFDP